MGKTTLPLTHKQIENSKPREKDYVLCDGDGLNLRVRKSGSRSWYLSYVAPRTKKRSNLCLGTYPELSLALARKMAREAKSLIYQGIDPKEHQKQQDRLQQEENEHTLLNISLQWLDIKKDSITADYAQDILRSLELYVFPTLGAYPIKKITAPIVIEILRPVEAKGSLETVKRLCQRLNEIMNYAVNSGLIHANPLIQIRNVFKKPKQEHMLTLPPEELSTLMHAIANASIRRKTRCLIEFQLHTMTRPNEAAGCRWDEIDFRQKTWTISSERMKMRNPHRIPLTPHTIQILNIVKPLCGNSEYVFSSDQDRSKPYHSQTVNAALKRMGFAGQLVSHGLRSLASTILNEEGFNKDWIEAALSHVDTNQIRSAYNRTDYLEKRREMMVWWSEYINQASIGTLSITSINALKP